jgi:hypothetical protein
MPENQMDCLVIFGATGDLAKLETFPALVGLVERGVLNVPVIGVSNMGWTLEHFREYAAASLGHNGLDPDSDAARRMLQLLRYIDGDLNDPAKIIAAAREKLDFTQPVAIMLMGILGHIGDPDSDQDQFAVSVVNHLKAALPAGGYLVIRDATNTVEAHVQALRAYEQTGAVPYRLRSPEQITRFFDGLVPIEPGIVPIQQWRPDQQSSQLPADINMLAGAAVKR